jgi:signal transduction histidine kinase
MRGSPKGTGASARTPAPTRSGDPDRLAGLLAATQAIAGDLDLDAVLHRIADEARLVLDARYAALVLLGANGQVTDVVHAAAGPDVPMHVTEPTVPDGLVHRLAGHPSPSRWYDVDPEALGLPTGHPVPRSLLSVPVRAHGRAFGALFATEKGDDGPFTPEDERLASSLAATAAVAIENARLFEDVSRRERWLSLSRATTNQLLGVPDLGAALRMLTSTAREAARSDLAAVIVRDVDGTMRVAAVDVEGAATGLLGGVAPAGSPGVVAMLEGHAVVLDDLQAHPEMAGPMHRYGVGPVAAVPLAAHDQVLGALVLGNLPGRPTFGDEDVAMLGEFATQVALVLLAASARETKLRLELVAERSRIARDLHDTAIQGVFSVGLALNGLAARAGGQVGVELTALADRLDDAIRSVRQSIFALQSQTEEGGAELRAQLSDVTHAASGALGFQPTLTVLGPVDSVVSAEVAEDLLSVLREALANAARHADARRVEVQVVAGDGLTLEVRDDGRGLGRPGWARGLSDIQDKAQRHGGRLEIASREGGGTVLRWVVPYAVPTPPRPRPESVIQPTSDP